MELGFKASGFREDDLYVPNVVGFFGRVGCFLYPSR